MLVYDGGPTEVVDVGEPVEPREVDLDPVLSRLKASAQPSRTSLIRSD